MTTLSAGLINATNLTVTGTQSGAVQSTNFDKILDLSGNLSVAGDVVINGTLTVKNLIKII